MTSQYPPDWLYDTDEEPLITLAEAERFTRRPLRVLQRWVKAGILPVAHQEEGGRQRIYIRLEDLAIARRRKAWGKRKNGTTQGTTDSGKPMNLQHWVTTNSALPED
jgi:hypothetical protein